jgi:hypothetical protein
MFAVFPARPMCFPRQYELTLLFVYFLLWIACYSVSISTAALLGSSAGGEAQSKHKEGFDPLKC